MNSVLVYHSHPPDPLLSLVQHCHFGEFGKAPVPPPDTFRAHPAGPRTLKQNSDVVERGRAPRFLYVFPVVANCAMPLPVSR